ncbi:MAG: DUF5719 family protein [Acidimicrobiales bacterium]
MSMLTRLRVVALVVAILAGGAIVDRVVGRAPAPSPALPPPAEAAVVAGRGSQSAEWACPGGTGRTGPAPALIVMTNGSTRPVGGTLTAVSSTGARRTETISVPAASQVTAIPADMVTGAWVAASVLLDGGGVGVSEEVSGSPGWGVAACASTAAASWYFPGGSTGSGRSLYLALFNPGVTDAVVDISFATPTGVSEPPADQGVIVNPGALTVLNVGNHVLNEPRLATSVRALSGSVVASETEIPRPGLPNGIGLTLGSPLAATAWSFPQTTDQVGSYVAFNIFNPSSRPARVKARFAIAGGLRSTLTVEVASGSQKVLYTTGQARIPPGTSFASTFVSTRGVGVVIDRNVLAPPGAPPPRFGVTGGAVAGARTWLVPAVPAPGAGPWTLAVQDLAGRPVQVTVLALEDGQQVPIGSLDGLRVRAAEPLIIGPKPGPPVGRVPLLLRADGPVVVSFDVLPSGSPGVVSLPAIPIAD